MEIDMKRVSFWLYRIESEKINDCKKICERISELNYQQENFTKMFPRFQEEVIKELLKDIDYYDKHTTMNWNNARAELEAELEKFA